MQRIISVIDVELDKPDWNLRKKACKAYLMNIWGSNKAPEGMTIKKTNIHGSRLVFGTKLELENMIENVEANYPNFEKEFNLRFVSEVQSESTYATIMFVQWPTKLVELLKPNI